MFEDAEVSPEMLEGMLTRLETFVAPFAEARDEPAPRRHALEYITGLLSELKRTTGEALASLPDQQRQGLQKFIGHVPWDHPPGLAPLADQVGAPLGGPDAVLVFDPSAFPKKGVKSVGVARPWCGRLGEVDNCQVGISMASVSRKEHALVNLRLSLPEEWAQGRGRRQEAGVPETITSQTRHARAREMLKESGGGLPHAWVAGDDERGRPARFRQGLRTQNERYLRAVPSNLLIRDIEVTPPESAGRGRPPKVPFARWDRGCRALPEVAWTRIDVRDGAKGPLVIDVVTRRIQPRTETGGPGAEELLFVTRGRQADATSKHDSSFSNADPGTPLKERARVAKAEHRVAECLERATGEAGLGAGQGRKWIAWHQHPTLALLAAWFLTEETRRGKNPDPGADVAATSGAHRGRDRGSPRHPSPPFRLSSKHPLATPQ